LAWEQGRMRQSSGRYSLHRLPRRDVSNHNRTSSHNSPVADNDASQNHSASANNNTIPHDRGLARLITVIKRVDMPVIGERHIGANERIVANLARCNLAPPKYADPITYPAVVLYRCTLPDNTPLANTHTLADAGMVPYQGSVPYLTARVNDRIRAYCDTLAYHRIRLRNRLAGQRRALEGLHVNHGAPRSARVLPDMDLTRP